MPAPTIWMFVGAARRPPPRARCWVVRCAGRCGHRPLRSAYSGVRTSGGTRRSRPTFPLGSPSMFVGRGILDAPITHPIRGRQGCRPLRFGCSLVHPGGGGKPPPYGVVSIGSRKMERACQRRDTQVLPYVPCGQSVRVRGPLRKLVSNAITFLWQVHKMNRIFFAALTIKSISAIM